MLLFVYHCSTIFCIVFQILSELSEQRESLLRTQERLHSATENLSKSRAALNAIRKNILYNKFTLILIILLEIGILIGIIVLKVKKWDFVIFLRFVFIFIVNNKHFLITKEMFVYIIIPLEAFIWVNMATDDT